MDTTGRRNIIRYAVWGLAALIGSTLAVVSGAAVIAPITRRRSEQWLDLVSPEQLTTKPQRLNVIQQLQQGWQKTENTHVVYAFNSTNGESVVLSSVCSHLGCSVRWAEGENMFHCPCHGGVYDANGKVISGPPANPLMRYETRLEDNRLKIRLT